MYSDDKVRAQYIDHNYFKVRSGIPALTLASYLFRRLDPSPRCMFRVVVVVGRHVIF